MTKKNTKKGVGLLSRIKRNTKKQVTFKKINVSNNSLPSSVNKLFTKIVFPPHLSTNCDRITLS